MLHKPLYLVTDLYGCPNRCRHCWLGHMPNRVMEPGADAWLVDYFRPDFETVVFYSWLREPDFCDSYRARWERDNALSVGGKPERFELASFWRLVRDPDYAGFLKEVGVRQVQLTFFGLEELTDRYTGRKGAFRELLQRGKQGGGPRAAGTHQDAGAGKAMPGVRGRLQILRPRRELRRGEPEAVPYPYREGPYSGGAAALLSGL